MKLKKSISLLIPLLLFSLFAYADIDSHPDIIIIALFFYIFIFVLLIVYIVSIVKRFVYKDLKANKWIYLTSFIASCCTLYLIFLELEDTRMLKPIIILISILIFLVLVSIITYKKSIAKSDK